MSRGVRVTVILKVHTTHTHPYPTHIWTSTRVIDPYHFRTTYIYRTHKIEDAGWKNRGCNHHGSRYGNIRSSSNPVHNSVMNESILTTSVPSAPRPSILATNTDMDITIIQHNAIIFTVSMLLLFSSQDRIRTCTR